VTSHDVVAEVRRSLPRGTKVGHAGTLDPFATGLLLVLVGRATRAQRFLMELPKTYRAVARLGWVSDTGDRDGELVRTGRVPERLAIPVGAQMQRPPAFSAVKLGGRRAYELARAGERVEPEPRPVTVHRAELLWVDGERAAFEIECSAGTYVRTLIADLGDAYCDQLERTAIGPFRLEDADRGHIRPGHADFDPGHVRPGHADPDPGHVRPDDAGPGRLVPLGEALSFLPERALGEGEAAAARHGRPVAAGVHPAEHVRLVHEGELIAIAEPRGDELQPVVVFAPA
jgi:tRNA pseudouridine55 synthase